MKAAKKFDSVQMKAEIQAQLCKRWVGLTQEQIRAEVREHLASSEGEVARWWRSIGRGAGGQRRT